MVVAREMDVEGVTRALAAARISVTKLGASGGTLRGGRATLLIGVEDERVAEAERILRERARRRGRSSGVTWFVLRPTGVVEV